MVTILWIVIQLPFLSSAFRIDDPYFLAVTRQIIATPEPVRLSNQLGRDSGMGVQDSGQPSSCPSLFRGLALPFSLE